MATVASLWIGDSLGDIERASAMSFLKHGDRFILYVYSPVSNIPDGIEVRSASEIMPTHKIFRYKKTGSPALHADIFRIFLMQRTDYMWVDLDVVSLKSFDGLGGWIFGKETDCFVNNAVLKIPREATALDIISKYSIDFSGIPPFLTGSRKIRYQIKDFFKGGLSIEDWPWGALGPQLLTYALKQTGEIQHALPVSAFYAIGMHQIALFADPNGIDPSLIPQDAYALHLWGKELRIFLQTHHEGKAPKGSFIHQLLET